MREYYTYFFTEIMQEYKNIQTAIPDLDKLYPYSMRLCLKKFSKEEIKE